jgi:hypothetical protein
LKETTEQGSYRQVEGVVQGSGGEKIEGRMKEL